MNTKILSGFSLLMFAGYTVSVDALVIPAIILGLVGMISALIGIVEYHLG